MGPEPDGTVVGPKNDVLSAINALVAGAAVLILLFIAVWVVADQFVAECLPPIAPNRHAASECVQHNGVGVAFLIAAGVGLLLIGAAGVRSSTLIDQEGIRRRELFRYRLFPWNDVTEVQCRRTDARIQRVVAVRAVVRSRRAPVLLGQFRDPRAAADWTEALLRWRADPRVGPPPPPDA